MKFIPFVFALSMLVVTTTLPSPGDLLAEMRVQENSEIFAVEQPHNLRSVQFPPPAGPVVGYNLNSFEGSLCAQALASADGEALRSCSKVISNVVLQAVRFEASRGEVGPTAEQILLVATNMCRESWAVNKGEGIDFSIPACATSTLLLAQLGP